MYDTRTVASTLPFYNIVTTYNTRYLILLFIAKSKKYSNSSNEIDFHSNRQTPIMFNGEVLEWKQK